MNRHFSVGTVVNANMDNSATVLANAVQWIVGQQNKEGTWGGDDALDRLISTIHTGMALTSIGIPPSSSLLRPTFEYLQNIDKEKNVAFFWRAGLLLNIPEYDGLVQQDVEFMWEYRRRVGAHKDYPIPFFLLKILRFSDRRIQFRVKTQDVVKWILDEWDDSNCWYDRTSITSMALALLYDLKFPNRDHYVKRSIQYLEEHFEQLSTISGRFDSNPVDNCFLVFNLCERAVLTLPIARRLKKMVSAAADHVLSLFGTKPYITSPPPFGGNVGPTVYPTAVAVRAILSYHHHKDPFLICQTAGALISSQLMYREQPKSTLSFWGPATERDEGSCFILMPFGSEVLQEIYQRHIKDPIESTLGLRCIRADDIFQPTEIMRDVWRGICSAKCIIAELTGRNPNVFYELGLAHALGKYVVLIAQDMDFVPFDLQSIRVIIYRNSPSGYEDLTKRLLVFLREVAVIRPAAVNAPKSNH